MALAVLTHLQKGEFHEATAYFAETFQFNDWGIGLEFRDIERTLDWKFKWFSSNGSDFNFDYKVSFMPEDIEKGAPNYNYGTIPFRLEEGPGLSAFYKEEAGTLYRTYSTFARGLDMNSPSRRGTWRLEASLGI